MTTRWHNDYSFLVSVENGPSQEKGLISLNAKYAVEHAENFQICPSSVIHRDNFFIIHWTNRVERALFFPFLPLPLFCSLSKYTVTFLLYVPHSKGWDEDMGSRSKTLALMQYKSCAWKLLCCSLTLLKPLLSVFLKLNQTMGLYHLNQFLFSVQKNQSASISD